MIGISDFFSEVAVSRKIGTFRLDATVEESHQSTLKTTKNPIESGGVIADHAYLEPRQLTVRGIIVDYEVVSNVISAVMSPSMESTVGVLGDVITGDFNPFDPATQDKLLNDAGIFAGDYAIGAVRNIAPWLPNLVTRALDLGEAPSRIRKQLAELESMQASGEMLKISTKAKDYTNMVLQGLATVTRKDTVLEVVLSFGEIQVSAEQLVTSSGLTGGEADMRPKGGKGKDGDTDPTGDSGKDTRVPPKVNHQSVNERMRGQVEAELGKLKGRMGF